MTYFIFNTHYRYSHVGIIMLVFFLITGDAFSQPWTAHGKLVVSENKRFIQHNDGTPFFWLGDTGWDLFRVLSREDAELYLENRKQKGFTVVQLVALVESSGITQPNVYGHYALINSDPSRPDVKDGANNDYWDHVDWVINKAAEKGLYVGFLPTWGSHVTGIGATKIFNPTNAKAYAEFIANRYKNQPNVIYISGGDRLGEWSRENWDAIHEALERVDGDRHLKTFHPYGPSRSSTWFHNEAWLDFNMVQSGHRQKDWDIGYTYIEQDYALTPPKPTINGEPPYENHDVNWKNGAEGYFDDYDVRQAAYWAVFAGAFGHTYGAKPIWYFGGAYNGKDWKQAMDLPGAYDMTEVKELMLSRPFLSRVPDQSLLSGGAGSGADHMQATRGDGYAFIYFSTGQTKTIELGKISGTQIKAWWYNPRSGEATLIDTYSNSGTRSFDPPGTQSRGNDWVLVLDDASRNFSAPGVVGPVVVDNEDPTTPSGLTSPGVTYNSVTLSWTASTDNIGVVGYNVYRGTTKVNTSLITTTTYTITGLTASTAYTFTVTAQDAAGNESPATSPISVTTAAAPNDSKVTGTTFGTSPWTGCTTCTYDKAFDNNTSTYFDANDANGAYAGIDAGSAKTVTRIRFYPRSGNTARMVGGKFQGSNTSSSAGFVDLYTISAEPALAWQEVNVNATTAYRYLRYLAPNGGHGNVAEVEFYATTGTTSTLRDPENPASTVAGLEYKYFEGTWTTLPNFDALTAAETGNVDNFDMSVRNRTDNYGFKYTGYINITTEGTYTFYTSSDDGSKLYIGSTEVVSNDGLHGTQERSGTIGLKAGKHAIRVTFFEATGGEVLTVSYAGPNIAKTTIPASALFRNGTSTGTLTKATGTTFGTTVWTGCTTCSFDKVYDGNTSTYFDAADANGAYAGIDAGSARVITRIRFYPRSTNLDRMVGGKFQGSNTSSSAGFVDLYTIPSQPTNAWQQIDIPNTTGYRYLRYLSPNGGYGNVAEVEFYYNNTSTARSASPEVTIMTETYEQADVAVYPNPGKNLLTLEYEVQTEQDVQIEMTSTLAQPLLIIQRRAKKGNNIEQINISDFKSGVYFITIKKKNGHVTQKVILEK